MSAPETSTHPDEPAEGGDVPDAGPGAERVLNPDRPSEERQIGGSGDER